MTSKHEFVGFAQTHFVALKALCTIHHGTEHLAV